jgi:hypothetical protein
VELADGVFNIEKHLGSYEIAENLLRMIGFIFSQWKIHYLGNLCREYDLFFCSSSRSKDL